MARIVIKDAKKPQEVEGKMICMCGLSENQPFCNGSHKKTEDEKDESVYQYIEGERFEIGELDNEDGSNIEEHECCHQHGDEAGEGKSDCCGRCHHHE